MSFPQQSGPETPKSAWSAPIVITAGFAGLIVLALSIILGLLFISPKDKDQNQSQSPSGQQSTPLPSSPDTGPDSVEPSVSSQPSTTSSSTTPHAQPTIPGTDWQGFLTGGPRCNAAEDPAMLIAQTNRSQIVICRVGQRGGFYYKGLAGGNAIEIQNPSPIVDGWQAANNGVSYRITSGALMIIQNGRTFSEPTQQHWSK